MRESKGQIKRHLKLRSALKVGLFSIFTLPLLTIMGCQQKEEPVVSEKADERIFERGAEGPKDFFTGQTFVKMLVTDEKHDFQTAAYNVEFMPGARTYWHSHPGGQLLFVTEGQGWYQEKGQPARALSKGDVVEIPPNVVHWHGAAEGSFFVHLGMSTRTSEGPAVWEGPVTEEQYSSLKN